MKTRIYFLDNLRTFLIFLVIVLHAGMTYERGFDSFWIVSDPSKYDPLAWIRTYLDLFIMFTMFFISGYFVPGSLKSKGGRGFIVSKLKRIMLPWLVAVFTLIPAYKAIFLLSRGMPQEEWFSYFHIFQRTGSDLSFVANNPNQNWLWFLPVLFLFQVLYFAMSKTNLLSLKISLKTGVILTFLIGLFYSLVISFSGLKGWEQSAILDFQRERLLIYFMAFLLGSLCNKLEVFKGAIKTSKYFIVAVVVMVPLLILFKVVALNLFYNLIEPGRDIFLVSEFIDILGYYSLILISMLGFLIILTYIFRYLFDKISRITDVLSKSSYQVYIIHMIVLGVLALGLTYVTAHALVKYVILIIFTFLISNIIVYAYKKILQKSIYKIAALSVSVVLLFALITVGNNTVQESSDDLNNISEIQIPAMGLHEAALLGNTEVVDQHIKAGSDLNIKDASGGSSPLITAITFGKAEVARMLIDAGADINFIKNDGASPLHVAAFFCHPEIVEMLLQKGADKSIVNNSGSTALGSVEVPFEAVKGIYDYLGKVLGPLGLQLDYEYIIKTRPLIAEMLR